MKRKTVFGIMLTLLSISTVTLVFNIQPVEASGTIRIEANGSVNPDTAPLKREGDIYTFSDNVYDSIQVWKDNIVIDGVGYTLQGPGRERTGISLWGNNVTIKNINIQGFNYGAWLHYSSYSSIYENTIKHNNKDSIRCDWSFNNRIYGNNITNHGGSIWLWASSNNSIHENNIEDSGGIALNGYPGNLSSFNTIYWNNITNGGGIRLEDSSHNDIYENNIITENYVGGIELRYSSNNSIRGNNVTNIHTSIHHEGIGIWLYESSNNTIYHNNFINYTRNAATRNSVNFWDDGYPSGGNLWSDYPGEDRDGDGIGDTPYVIDNNNRDNFPLMGPWIYKKRLPFWHPWWAIVMGGIGVLAGILYFLKKRKPSTSTPPLSAEGTETPMHACAGPAESANSAFQEPFTTRKKRGGGNLRSAKGAPERTKCTPGDLAEGARSYGR